MACILRITHIHKHIYMYVYSYIRIYHTIYIINDRCGKFFQIFICVTFVSSYNVSQYFFVSVAITYSNLYDEYRARGSVPNAKSFIYGAVLLVLLVVAFQLFICWLLLFFFSVGNIKLASQRGRNFHKIYQRTLTASKGHHMRIKYA